LENAKTVTTSRTSREETQEVSIDNMANEDNHSNFVEGKLLSALVIVTGQFNIT